MPVKAALKGREPLIYARVSTGEQKATLPAQAGTVADWLKGLGVRRKPRVFMEQVSGTKRLAQRPVLAEMIEYANTKPGKVAIVVRDTQRLSRNPWIAGAIYDPMREIDVPLISMEAGGKVASTDKTVQVEGDLLMPILTAVGGQEISLRLEQTKAGVAAARKKGVFTGSPLSLYSSEPLNPYRELHRLRPLIIAKELPQARAAARLEKSTSWLRKTLIRLSDVEGLVGTDGLMKWLDTLDLIRAMEQAHGEGMGSRATKAMRAVRRQTVAYISQPDKWPKPTQATLDDYFTNWRKYQPKRTK